MKTVIFAALAAAAVSAPAFAQDAAPFTGPRAGVTLGYDKFDGNDGFAYGASTGYDIAITPNVTFGPEVAFSDSTTSLGAGVAVSRDLSSSVRLGYILNPKVLAFCQVGYATTLLSPSHPHPGGSFEVV